MADGLRGRRHPRAPLIIDISSGSSSDSDTDTFEESHEDVDPSSDASFWARHPAHNHSSSFSRTAPRTLQQSVPPVARTSTRGRGRSHFYGMAAVALARSRRDELQPPARTPLRPEYVPRRELRDESSTDSALVGSNPSVTSPYYGCPRSFNGSS